MLSDCVFDRSGESRAAAPLVPAAAGGPDRIAMLLLQYLNPHSALLCLFAHHVLVRGTDKLHLVRVRAVQAVDEALREPRQVRGREHAALRGIPGGMDGVAAMQSTRISGVRSEVCAMPAIP